MSTFGFTDADAFGGLPVARRIADAGPRTRLVVTGTIVSWCCVLVDASPAGSCLLDDGTGRIELLFVGRPTIAGLSAGARCTVEATAVADGSRLVLWNPLYRIEPADAGGDGPVPA